MRTICLVLIVGFTNILYAKNSYHMNELVSMVIKNHPSIKVQEQIIRGANAQVEGAKWNYFPTVSFSANQGVNRKKPWDGTAALSQPLWTGGKLDAAYDMAVANRFNSESGLEESGYILLDALFNALKTYLKSKGNLKALVEGEKQLKTLEEMVSRRIDAGISSRSDMELLKARLYQMQTDINFAKASMQASLSQIELLTNHNFREGLEINERMNYDFGSLDDQIKSMIETHPTLKKYDALIDYAEAEKSKAEAAFLPNVSLKVQRGVGSNDYYYNDSIRETRVYVSVDASFGAGLSVISGIEEAEAKIIQLKQEKLSTQQDLMNQIMFAYNDYISSSSRVQSQSGSISSSQKVFESYTRLFLAGKRQWLDLVNTSRELTQNEMAYADTESTLLISTYQLLLLSGKSNLLNTIPDKKTIATKKTVFKEVDKLLMPSMETLPAKADQKVKQKPIQQKKQKDIAKPEQEHLASISHTTTEPDKKTIKTAFTEEDKPLIVSRETLPAKADQKVKQKQNQQNKQKNITKLEQEHLSRISHAAKQNKANERVKTAESKTVKRPIESVAKNEKKISNIATQKSTNDTVKTTEKKTSKKREKENTKSISAGPKYYVQFERQLNDAMKNEFKKQNLTMQTTKDGRYVVGSYDRPGEALAVAREIKKIIHDEAYIVRQ